MKTKKLISIGAMLLIATFAFAKNVVLEIKVEGQCGECKERIEAALDIPGISYALWDVDTKVLKIRFNNKKYSEDDIHKIISNLGYSTSKLKANAEAEKKLPSCCQPNGAECESGE